MKLEQLDIQGFKSFKDRTLIAFDDGVTGIVGPNGCGKSNIVDALFWVMGEQSAKHLRGNKMSDLIFSGSSKHSPASFAEVTLSLKNTDGKAIHIGQKVVAPTDIHLTRKLYRNGETEYRINGEPARLKDIQEVFLDTGAGAKSYSIIAQGEIDRLVRAKPEERKSMIEEVAGITKFKLRKKESLRKIEQTQSNLERLKDLEKEVHKQLKTLEKQAEKANRAKNLKEKISKYELIVAAHKERDYLESFSKNNKTVLESQVEIESLSARQAELELSLEQERIAKEELVEKLDQLQKIYNEESRKLAASEERALFLKKNLEQRENFQQSKLEEVDRLQAQIESRKNRLAEVEQELQGHRENKVESEDFSQFELKIDEQKRKLANFEEEKKQLQSELLEQEQSLNEKKQELYQNTSQLNEASNTMQEISQEMETLEEESSYYNDQLVEKRSELKRLDESLKTLEAQKEKLTPQVAEEKDQWQECEKKVRELKQRIELAQGQKETLESVTFSEVEKGQTQQLIQDCDEIHLLGEQLVVPDEWMQPVQRLLAPYLNNAVGRDQSLWQSQVMQWREEQAKNLDYLHLATHVNSSQVSDLGLKSITEVLKIEDQYLRDLLSGFYIAPQLEMKTIDEHLQKISNFAALVDPSGKLVIRKNENLIQVDLLQDADNEQFQQGILARNQKITRLSEELSETKSLLEKQSSHLSKLEQNYKTHQEELQAVSENLHKAKIDYASLKSELSTQEKSFEAGSSRLKILQTKKEQTSNRRLDLMEMEEILETQKEEIEGQIKLKKEELYQSEQNLEQFSNEFQALKDEYNQKKAMSQTYEQQLGAYQRQIEDLKQQALEFEQQLVQTKEVLEQLEQEIEQIHTDQHEVAESNQQMAQQLSEQERQLSEVKGELDELNQNMQSREAEEKKIRETKSKHEKNLIESELKIEQVKEEEELLVRNLFEQHRVDLRKSLSQFMDLEHDLMDQLKDLSAMYVMQTEEGEETLTAHPYEFEKKFPAQLAEIKEKLKKNKQEMNRLGEINWQAMQDYETQKKRYQFLVDQASELSASLEDLHQAINHIDEKSKIRFNQAFEEVNERFTKVFPIIFGGGSARLQLVPVAKTDELGVEIIAQPPGKKMQSINLMSGGEKAMTAVSLIFSIFLVKPSPFCLLDEVDAPLDDANVGRFNELLREMSSESQFILITHNKKTMELNDRLYGVTMQDPGVSKAVSVMLH